MRRSTGQRTRGIAPRSPWSAGACRPACRAAIPCVLALAAAVSGGGALSAEAPVLLRDIQRAAGDVRLAESADLGGTSLFKASDGRTGYELWATDGTPEGTRLLRDIRPGPDGIEGKDAWAEDLRAPVEAGGSVWLSADDGANGPELWTSDGTPEGTLLVADLRPGSAGSQPRNLLGLDGFLYLEADDGVHGREPWAVRVEPGADREFRRGDADADGRASIADVVRLLDHLFRDGSPPPCPDAADADDDGRLRVTDAVLEATWLFRGGPAPPFPGPATCGPDPTPDTLGCPAFPPCEG